MPNTIPFKKRIFTSVIIGFVFSFTYLVFFPYEVIIGNSSEFKFDFASSWSVLLIAAVVLWIAVSALLLIFRGVIYKILSSLFIGATLAGYVQSMFLNGKMQQMDGLETVGTGVTSIIKAIIWAIVFLLPLIIAFTYKKIWKNAVTYIAVFLALVQLTGAVFLVVNTESNKLKHEPQSTITNKGLYNVSKDKNVIIFILDRFDSSFMNTIIADKDPVLNRLPGFTFYEDSVGPFSFTHIAMPYLMTANFIKEYNPSDKQFTDAYEKSDYFKAIRENASTADYFTEEFVVTGEYARSQIDNCEFIKTEINKKRLLANSLKASLYRAVPDFVKSRFSYYSNEINNEVVITEDSEYNPYNVLAICDAGFGNTVKECGLSATEAGNSFKLIHLYGPHGMDTLTKDGQFTGDNPSDVISTSIGTLNIVGNYFDELEKLGLYENSDILLLADHGINNGSCYDYSQFEISSPLIMYKPAGKKYTDDFTVSKAQVSQADVFPTVLNALGADYGKYGTPLNMLPEDRKALRYYYFPLCLEKDTLSQFKHIEYEVDGYVFDSDSWKRTGVEHKPN